MLKYIVISPVKDEAQYVEHTLRSMASQTAKPVQWIIVDDGSSDKTPEIVERYRPTNNYINLVRCLSGQARQPGAGVIRAFNIGYEIAKNLDYDLVVKLDCDLSFETDYFEKLLEKFDSEPKLGIASGVYLEDVKGLGWTLMPMPDYHAAGASKVVRRHCFEQIGGFVAARGWDTIDEIRAMTHGWRTGHFPELQMKHWKPEGIGIGLWRTSIMHGHIYYMTGGGLSFFALKVINRMRFKPFIFGGIGMIWGYFRSAFTRKARLVTPAEAHLYRSLLQGRISRKIGAYFGHGKTKK